jgi:NADH-quinone oxidoreductase subunit L
VFAYFGTLRYAEVFAAAPAMAANTLELVPGAPWLLVTVICVCLFIGAMGKSAQFPLHVWLPDSMEGPTPISALIHAATMVTAGIFMVARMSPLFELSDAALSFVIVIGAITAFFMGILGIVQNDIKRVVAYSTLSQLGYMTVALGASAYAAGIFHLMTHAFFKALLFLAAGSVIIGLHHQQDIRAMGGLWRRMPVTWITALVGSLALVGTPFFAGFYSKDAIILATEASARAGHSGATIAYWALTIGVFITAFYTFRMFFLVFHGQPRWHRDLGHGEEHDEQPASHGHDEQHVEPHESPSVVTVPLVLLAIPSAVIGFVAIETMLAGDFFGSSIVVDAARHPAMREFAAHFESAAAMGLHGLVTAPFFLALAGVALAWFFYLRRPDIPAALKERFAGVYRLLDNKYYLDRINEVVFASGARTLGEGLWKRGDIGLIDGLAVNGSARVVGWIAMASRLLQSGYIYHYAFAMIIGVLVMITLFVTLAVGR